ncbi:MAG: methyltransferase domain-containing protein [bacterium]|nr:methyltransferase domain-containing protein [bacterium]
MISMKEHVKIVDLDVRAQCEISSQCNILLINTLGGIGDILCTRLIFEDLKQVPKIGKITFAVPCKYLSLIEDCPFIDHILAVEDLKPNCYNQYILAKDITQVPGEIECRTMPNVTENRADIIAGSIGLKLKSHQGHLTFTDQEIKWAQEYIDQFGSNKKIGIAPFSTHLSKDLDISLVEQLVLWCQDKDITSLIFHNKEVNIEGAVIIKDLTLRQWMAVVSLLDAVVTVSTAMFWISQLTYRPTVAVFGCEDLQVFGKYHLNLLSVQRRSIRNILKYASITAKQEEIKEFQGEWSYCPCWDARKCAFKKWNDYPPLCLESIKADKIIEKIETLLDAPNLTSCFDENYFMTHGHLGWYDGSAWGIQNEFHKKYAEFLLTVLPAIPGRLLDVGGAFGDLVYHLREQGIDAYGVEISEYAVEHRHVQTLYQADVSEKIPFASEFFDMVISRDCLEHIPEGKISATLLNIKRVLKIGGMAFLAIATNFRDKETKKRSNKIFRDATHVTIRDSTWWIKKLEQTGMVEDRETSRRAMEYPLAHDNDWKIFVFRKEQI